MKLLVDNNLSYTIAHCLQSIFPEHKILSLREKFASNTKDAEWINALDNEGGWAVLTIERRLKTRPHERLALDRSKIVFFFLTGAWLKYGVPETAWRLIRLVPLMNQQSSLTESGLFDLPVNASSKLRPHSSIAITMDIYSHLMPNMQGEAAVTVDGVMRAAINKRAEDEA